MTVPEKLDSEIEALEAQLGDSLRSELGSAKVVIPDDADRAARAVIRSRAAEIRRDALKSRSFFWPAAAAAAAALLLAAGAWLAVSSMKTPLRGDVDRSGRVDIVDAYLLARRLETGGKAEASWDLTGDGQVNVADVTAVAKQSVSLAGGAR